MGQIFSLDPAVISTMASAIDDLILYLGKECKVVYPPKIIACVNCLVDPIGKKSKNIYLSGGPVPFPQGSICPVCDGAGGTLASETFDIVQVILHWQPREFGGVKLDNVRLAKGVIKIKGYLSDLPKFQRCSYMIPHINIDAFLHYRFRLSSEPVSNGNIVQARYFSALFDRIQ